MESESLSMMTMNEMRTLMETLSAIYTDVCLLSADDVNDVHEGAYTASSEGKCYACGHKRHFSRHCAAKQALATGEKACRIERAAPPAPAYRPLCPVPSKFSCS